MNLSEFIKQSRQAAGLSLREVASRCEVNVAYLSRTENNQLQPSEGVLRKLSQVLDVNEDELFLLAGRLPSSLLAMVEKEPDRATYALQSFAAMMVSEPELAYGATEITADTQRVLENGFPFAELSEVAEIESWRKEIHRPVYHLHKWWAQRLGSVFRAVILGAALPEGSAVMKLYYQPVKLPPLVVFDPFMGSGTTLGEAHKLGCTVIGRDINPVAWRSVRTALGPMSRKNLVKLFDQLASTTGPEISALYRGIDRSGRPCHVLYFFWVKILPCPACGENVDLFNSYSFAQHAYPKKFLQIQIVCPDCGAIFEGKYDQAATTCPTCAYSFRHNEGPAVKAKAICRACSHEFKIAKTALAQGQPPGHRLYAKLVLTEDGEKEYLPASEADFEEFASAAARLKELNPPLPDVEIRDGYNTRQVMNYGYTRWSQMFNDRQLLALTLLASGIKALPDCPEKDALMLLFSGVLEFNNMFASYKGEGTGAVRHMFAHHILKPERMPIEANVWGTPKSSGAFSTLFKSRLLRALDYREAPFEVRVTEKDGKKEGVKVFGLSPPMGGEIFSTYPASGLPPRSMYLSCGNSAATDIPNGVVDLVITDPPFFDNVHYSELADFFHVWQRLYCENGECGETTTRNAGEVQDTDAASFGDKLKSVFLECHRVLRDDGLMVFSYHHSREDGWFSIAKAVLGAGFSFVQAQPVKAEMSVAMPKSQAKEPIDVDILLVCRKRRHDYRTIHTPENAVGRAQAAAIDKVARFNRLGRMLSRTDILVVFLSQLLVELSAGRKESEAVAAFEPLLAEARVVVETIFGRQKKGGPTEKEPAQLRLLFSAG